MRRDRETWVLMIVCTVIVLLFYGASLWAALHDAP